MKSTRHSIRVKSGKKVSYRTSALSRSLQDELLRFMEYHPVSRFNRNLRKMLLEFLMQNGSVENLYFKDLVYDLDGLFELLDAIEIESKTGSN